MEPYVSTISAGGCPPQDLLFEFDLGRLSETELDAIAAHLSSCDRCEESLDELRAQVAEDQGITLIRSCMRRPSSSDELGFVLKEAGAEEIGATSAPPGQTVTISEETEGRRESWRAPRESQVWAIGQYELRGQIGRGGMGVVHRAYQIPLRRMVALKMILGGHHACERTLARFDREGQSLARLRHPNVVQVYELGEADGHPYFSMELIEGGNLQARLNQGPFEFREAAELVRTVAEAVDFAHGQGVVHRDLKPANILLDAKSGTPKITDFGLAKLLDTDPDGDSSSDLTESGSVMGTASYMAPEQAEGRSDVGPPADVHALGAILYALLTGHPPFVGETKFQTLDLVRTAQPIPPSRVREGGVPFGLESICLKCLEKTPERRYASAQALADDLGRWLNDERPQAIPGLLTRARRIARRNRVAVLIGATLLAVGIVLFALGLIRHKWINEFARKRIEDELAHGRAVTLIGQTGEPRWMRWRLGKADSQVVVADDGTLAITTWTLGLLELATDPGSDRYRITAQVRHEKADTMGEVGLYFGRKNVTPGPAGADLFATLSFNAVRGDADLRARLPAELVPRNPRSPLDNAVKLKTRLVIGVTPKNPFNWELFSVYGPRFKPAGEWNGRWHDLELTVTPEKVTARWDGQTFAATTSEIQGRIKKMMTTYPPAPSSPIPRGFIPTFNPRGGLGLYVLQGYASFRSVTVTPL